MAARNPSFQPSADERQRVSQKTSQSQGDGRNAVRPNAPQIGAGSEIRRRVSRVVTLSM
jgi:hypothetical protein